MHLEAMNLFIRAISLGWESVGETGPVHDRLGRRDLRETMILYLITLPPIGLASYQKGALGSCGGCNLIVRSGRTGFARVVAACPSRVVPVDAVSQDATEAIVELA